MPLQKQSPDWAVGRGYFSGALLKSNIGYPRIAILLSRSTPRKNKQICDAFVAGLPSSDQLSKYTNMNVLPTYWLSVVDVPEDRTKDCRWLLANYDYDQGEALLSAYQLGMRKGPALLAVDDRANHITVDFAKANRRDSEAFLATWFTKIPSDGGTIVIRSETLWDKVSSFACRFSAAAVEKPKADDTVPKRDTGYVDDAARLIKTAQYYTSETLMFASTLGTALCPAPATGAGRT